MSLFSFQGTILPLFGDPDSKFPSAFVILFSDTNGDKRDRTVDPLLAKQVLSQLSYTPVRDRTGLFYNADTSFDASASQTLRFALAASFNVQTFI